MTTKNQNTPATQEQKGQTQKPTASERFTNMVMAEFSGKTSGAELSQAQKRLIQNYFIATDISLKSAEAKRLKKSEQYRDNLPVTWDNVNMPELAINVVACSRIGLDPALPNQINMIPYKNNTIQKYDVGFIDGYRGKELVAMKYGLDVPDHLTIELVYSKDKFKPIKKDKNNDVETYLFEVSENPFERGEIVGGFFYKEYHSEPKKNSLRFLSKHEIEKRKPEYASPEFWGGEKAKWQNGQKVGTEKVEGWYDEMMWKTLARAAYNSITIDGKKIDDNYLRIIEAEELRQIHQDPEKSAQDAIANNANKSTLNIDAEDAQEVNDDPPADEKEQDQHESNQEPENEPEKVQQGTMTGPGF